MQGSACAADASTLSGGFSKLKSREAIINYGFFFFLEEEVEKCVHIICDSGEG